VWTCGRGPRIGVTVREPNSVEGISAPITIILLQWQEWFCREVKKSSNAHVQGIASVFFLYSHIKELKLVELVGAHHGA
jgi:hypothetical protein